MSSDNVQVFSYTTPLNALATYTSEKMILGQYISLSAVCYGDQTFNFIYDFSGDGSNWDISVSQSITSSTGTQIATPVKAKWTRIRLISTSGVNQTILRVFVYATPSNSSLQAQLSGIGNFNPKVDIGADIQKTSFDEILTQEYRPSVAFKFDQIVGGSLYNPTLGLAYQSPYLQGFDRWTYSGGISTDGVVTKGDSTLRLSTNETTLNTDYILASKIVPYSVGISQIALFTIAFKQATVRTNNARLLAGVFSVQGSLGNGTLYDGFLIGYDDMTVMTSQLEIAWYRGGVLQERIPQSNWNIDPCDGSVKAQNINPNNLNVIKLTIGYLGIAGCLFSILGTDGRFYPIHHIKPQNASQNTQWRVSGSRVGILVRASVVSTSKDGYIETGSISMGLAGPRIANSFLICRSNTITASTSEACLIAVRNDSSAVTKFGVPNHLCYALEALKVAVTSPNNVITFIRIYKNLTTLTGAYIATGSTNNSTYWATNEGSYATGQLVNEIPISQDSTYAFEMDSNEESIRNMFWSLQPGENYCITGITSSSTTTLAGSLAWHHL